MAKLDMSEFVETDDATDQNVDTEDVLTDKGFRLTDELEELKEKHLRDDQSWQLADENGAFGIFLRMFFDEKGMERIQNARQSILRSLAKINPMNIFVRRFRAKPENDNQK